MILVRALPSWDAPSIRVDFLLVRRNEEDGISPETWEEFISECRTRTSFSANITATWEEIPLLHLQARRYLESEILDLDYLSDGTRK
jgi:hypothetical protein